MSEPDRNPYAPPAAPVADAVLLSETREPRPIQVTWAVRLFWVELVLSVVQGTLEFLQAPDTLSRGALLLAATPLLLLEAGVIYKISTGKNWARIVALVSVVLSVPAWVLSVKGSVGAGPVSAVVLGAVELVLDFMALSLLFLTSGRQWFRRRVA